MISLAPPIRIATAADAAVLAELVNQAGEGLPAELWTQMAGPDEDPWDVGRARQAAKAERGEIYVVDEGSGVIAGLTGYAISGDPEPIPDDMPPLVQGLQELENLAPETWYVNVLAVLPGHRDRGLGRRLLDLAETIARGSDIHRTSLIVADTNTAARRLYERTGYCEISRRPLLPCGWPTDIREWILMIKPLSAN